MAVTAALLAALSAAPVSAVERTGTVDVVKPDEEMVVINDFIYRVAPGLRMRDRRGALVPWPRAIEPGAHVRFFVDGEGGGRTGAVTAMEIVPGGARASTE